MTTPTLAPSYADLAHVRRLLNVTPEPALDAVLARIAAGVTATISDVRSGLGVTWAGGDPVPFIRPVELLNGTGYFVVPAMAILDVTIDVAPPSWVGGGPLSVSFAPALGNPDRGWFRAVRLGEYANAINQTVSVTAVWADRPGGEPPAAVVTFASWATAQLWRRQSAGHSGQIGPEGYTVTTDDPWKSQDWKNLRSAYRVPRAGVV